MPNEKDTLGDEERGFVDGMGALMARWGIPRTTGRVYAYLLLCAEPVGLDAIAAGLEVSKSGASVAARQLELFRLARHRGQRGSRRVLYEAAETYDIGSSRDLIGHLVALYRAGAGATSSDLVRARLEDSAGFYETYAEQYDALVRSWRERRS